MKDNLNQQNLKCKKKKPSSGFIIAVAVLMLIGLVLTALAALTNICGLSKSDVRRKYLFYRIATACAIIAGR